MIHLSPTQSNVVVRSLYGSCNNITNPFFTWRVVDRNGYNEYIFTTDDNSDSSYYYNSFTISVGIGSATAGYFNGNPGEHHYYIYEKSTQYDLTISDNDRLVDVGLLYITSTSSEPISFTHSDNDIIYYFKNLD
jgi:hypothetical protein